MRDERVVKRGEAEGEVASEIEGFIADHKKGGGEGRNRTNLDKAPLPTTVLKTALFSLPVVI